MTTTERIIADIFSKTGIEATNEREQADVKSIIEDDNLSNEDKTSLIMEELRLRGSLFRKDIFQVLEFYTL